MSRTEGAGMNMEYGGFTAGDVPFSCISKVLCTLDRVFDCISKLANVHLKGTLHIWEHIEKAEHNSPELKLRIDFVRIIVHSIVVFIELRFKDI